MPLVKTRRGKGLEADAVRREAGNQAGDRMQARLGLQLENLAQELVTEIKPFLEAAARQ